MPIGPRPQDVTRIRRAVAVYKVSSIITGTFLLLLVLMMVLRYGLGVDIELGGPFGFLYLQPKEQIVAINLSTGREIRRETTQIEETAAASPMAAIPMLK